MAGAIDPAMAGVSVREGQVLRLRPVGSARVQAPSLMQLMPSGASGTIARARLLAKICTGREPPRSCLLVAPVGCGKTHLLIELADYSRRNGRPVSWLSLSPCHAGPDAFLALLEEAFAPSASRRPALDHLDTAAWSDISARHLLASLADRAPSTFCLDNIEALRHPKSRALLERLIESWPRGHFLYCAGRSLCGMRVAQAILNGTTVEIGARELALDPLELATLAGEIDGGHDAPAYAESVAFRANGWIAGVRALLMSRRTPEPATVSIPPILERYFEERVCGSLTAEQVSALLDLAALDIFNVELLLDLPERPIAWHMFETLSQEGVYFELLDQDWSNDSRRWYRVQPLLAEFLLQRRGGTDPQRVAALHRFAAQWLEARGFVDEAVRHALQCGDPRFSAALLERTGAVALELRQGVTLFRSGSAFAGLDARRHPLLALGQVYVDAQEGRVIEARARFEALRAATGSFQNWSDSTPGPEAHRLVDLFESVLEIYEDQPCNPDMLHRLQKHVDSHDVEPIVRASHASVLALLYVGNGMFLEAQTVCEIGFAAIRSLRAQHINFYLRVQQAHATIALGRLQEAVLHIERARDIAISTPSGWPQGVAVADVLRGVLHYEANELDEAEKLLSRALPRQPMFTAWFEIYALGFITKAAIAGVKRGTGAVFEVLTDLESLSRRCRMPRLLDLAAILRLREAIRAGNLTVAMDLLRGERLSMLTSVQERVTESWELRLRTLALVEGARLLATLDRPSDAIDLLARVDRRYVYEGDARERFAFLALSASLAFRMSRLDEAFDNFRSALDLALAAGLTRRLLDHREELLLIFDSAVSTGQPLSSRAAQFCTSVLRSASDAEPRVALERRLLPEKRPAPTHELNLTPRESEILALLTEGLSSKEICYRLSVSESTVKTHRRRLYQKLGVSRRSQAIARARAARLV